MSERVSNKQLERMRRFAEDGAIGSPEESSQIGMLLAELVERRAGDALQQRLNTEQNNRIAELEEKLKLNDEIVARLKNAVPQIKAAASMAKLQVPGSEVELGILAINNVGGKIVARFTFEVLEDVAKLIGVEDVAQPGLIAPPGSILA